MKHDHLTILMTTRMITTITGMKITQGMGMLTMTTRGTIMKITRGMGTMTTTIQSTITGMDMGTTTTTIPTITAKPVGGAYIYRFS